MRYAQATVITSLATLLLAALMTNAASVGASSPATSNVPSFTPAVSVTAPGSVAQYPQFNAVSCWSPGECLAVGSAYDGSSSTYPAYALEASGHWGPAQVIDAGHFPGWAYGVSCWAQSQCAVVGFASATNTAFGIIYRAGSWTDTLLTGMDLYVYPTLKSVSCRSDGSCVAVGVASGFSGSNGIATTFSQDSWSPLTPTSLSDSDVSSLRGVSCVNQGGCTAVGADASGPLVMTAPLGSPTFTNPHTIAGPTSQPQARLLSVSCSTASDCTAIGSAGAYGCAGDHILHASTPKAACATKRNQIGFDYVNNVSGFAVDESNGTWNPSVAMVQNAAASGSGPTSVSCTSPGYCVEVGTTLVNNVDQGAFATEIHGVWNRESLVTLAQDQSYLYLNGVSCTQPGGCTAVGFGSAGMMATDSPANVPPTTPTTMPPATLATTAPTTPSATLAATGSNEVLLLVGSLVLTVLGLALVLRRRIAIPRAE
jgi:hypothetical protein